MTTEDLFFKKIKKTTTCWLWTGGCSGRGMQYGKFQVERKGIPAHRFSYELHKGKIPKGLHIDHLCRNTLCVNPDHLEAVTCRENLLRGIGPTAINAAKKECINGHEFTDENTQYKPNGTRRCRICHLNNSNRHYREKIKKEQRKIPTHCRKGIHKFDDSNTLFTKQGRYCKICRNEKRRKTYHGVGTEFV